MGIPPVPPHIISKQDFGENRTQYNSGAGHSGRDYSTPEGSEIVSTEDGVVVMAGNSLHFPGDDSHEGYVKRLYFLKGGGGNVLVIDHGGYLSTYSHLSAFRARVGDRVRKGQVVALSGWTGYVVPEGPGGAHLHFEIMEKLPGGGFNWLSGFYGRVHPGPYIKENYFKLPSTNQETAVGKAYTHVTTYSTPWVKPRSYWGYPAKPSGVAIHHWGNDGQKKENVAFFLSDGTRNPATATSAHTVLEDGWIATLAPPEVGTFHSGSALGNGALIGIECKPEMDKGTVDTLVQYIYELEKVYGSMDIYYHQELSATACPGRYVKIRDNIIKRVNAMHSNGGRDPELAQPKPAPAPAPKVATQSSGATTATPKETPVAFPTAGQIAFGVWSFRNNHLGDTKSALQRLRDIESKQDEILEKLNTKEN